MGSVRDQLPGFGVLGRELERCGWRPAPSGPLEGGLVIQAGSGGIQAPARLYQSAHGDDQLLMVDFGDFQLGGRESLYPRFLDFPLQTRLVLGATELITRAGYLLLLSADRIEMFRIPEETLEYQAETHREFEDELLPALMAKGRRMGPALSALPNTMDLARALGGWIEHWGRLLASELGEKASDCEMLIWKIILILQTARQTGKNEMLGGWGLACEKIANTWTLTYDSLSTHDDFARALDDFDQTFSTRIFSGDAEMHQRWLERIAEGSLMEQFRAELLMQARLKFKAEAVAWIYSDIEREHEGWRREIAGLQPVHKRFSADGWVVLKPLVCDADRFGLSVALRDADRLAEFWNNYDLYMSARDPRHTENLCSQPDLFHGAPRGVGPLGRLDDGVNFLFSEALRIQGVPPESEFGVGVVFLLKALELVQRHDWPFFGVDTLDLLWRGADAT